MESDLKYSSDSYCKQLSGSCVVFLTALLVVVVAAMDFCAEQMAFTMGNAFLKTRVSHSGVAMLPTVTDKPESFRCGYCIN